MATKTYINHKEHAHSRTKNDTAKCRRFMERTGRPWDGKEPLDAPATKGRGKKAASTRKRNEKQKAQSMVVERLLDQTDDSIPNPLLALDEEPPEFADLTVTQPSGRDESGMYVHLTVEEWRKLIDSLEEAEAWLAQNATLLSATISTRIAGFEFIATYRLESGWAVTSQ